MCMYRGEASLGSLAVRGPPGLYTISVQTLVDQSAEAVQGSNVSVVIRDCEPVGARI
jgi:hypothetical protein